MKKNSKLHNEVREILSQDKQARDNDAVLIRQILICFYPELIVTGSKTGKPFFSLENDTALLMCSKIERYRRKVQETEFIPTLWAVAKKRRITEFKWDEYMMTHD